MRKRAGLESGAAAFLFRPNLLRDSEHLDPELSAIRNTVCHQSLDLVSVWVVIRPKSIPKEAVGGGYCRITHS